jgi:outer membrane lipoprotein carrier protein
LFVRSRISRLALLLLAPMLFGGGDELELLLDRFEARYEAMRDLKASFVQQSYVASLGREETSRGRLLYLRPGRFRWEIESPDPHTIVTDGEALRMFNPTERLLQVAPLGAGGLSNTALGFLFGEADLKESFTAERIEGPAAGGAPEAEETAERAGWVGLRLSPRKDRTFERLEVWLHPETLDVRELTILDLLANRTRLRLENLTQNSGLKEGAFTIAVPDDTEVIDLR